MQDKLPIDNCRLDIIYYHTGDQYGRIIIKINDDGSWVFFDSLHLDPESYLDSILAHIRTVIGLEERSS